jgi:hypothetical protein
MQESQINDAHKLGAQVDKLDAQQRWELLASDAASECDSQCNEHEVVLNEGIDV